MNNNENTLAKLDKATQLLAEAKTLDEVKHILDIAEAARVYARAAKLGLEAYNHAAEVKVRAERKAGELLKQLERTPPQKAVSLSNVESDYRAVLEENNIPNTTAFRWQQLAEMPEQTFNEHINHTIKEKPITTSGIIKDIQTEKRNRERSKMAQSAKNIKSSDKWHIYHGDIRNWIAPRKYDFIITDPPYLKEYLPLYEVLAQKANEWLKPDSLMIVMCGQSYLDEIYCMMSKHIEYYWTGAYLLPGQPTPMRQKQVNAVWKPLLMFSNGKYKGKIFSDIFKSDANDKSMHDWGQSESGMYDIVSKICLPGQYILDPFCGAGTTGIASMKHECLFDGLDIDIENINISKGRLSK